MEPSSGAETAFPHCKDAAKCVSSASQMRQRQQPSPSGENKHHHRVHRVGISLDGALGVRPNHPPAQKRHFPLLQRRSKDASKCVSSASQMRQRQQPTHSSENKHHHCLRRVGISLDGALGVRWDHLPRRNGNSPRLQKMRQSASHSASQVRPRPKSLPTKQMRQNFQQSQYAVWKSMRRAVD